MTKYKRSDWYVPEIGGTPQERGNIPLPTLLDPAHYAYSIPLTSEALVARQKYSELMTGDHQRNLTPKRLALHAAIVEVSVSLQAADEKEFQQVCGVLVALTQEAVKQHTALFEHNAVEVASEVEATMAHFREQPGAPECQELRQWKEKLANASVSAALTEDERLHVMAETLSDQLLVGKNRAAVANLLDVAMHSEEYHDTIKHMEPLTLQEQGERRALLVVGGPSSGKGSVTLLTKKSLLKNDAVEVNPDLYKRLLLPMETLDSSYDAAQTKLYHGSITHPESSLIYANILARWQEMALAGKAPNILIDTASASSKLLELASSKGKTQVEIHTPTLDTGRALTWSYKRGEQTGRFMPTQGLLERHQRQLATQSAAIDQGYNLVMYNTETLFGQPPDMILVADAEQKRIHILDLDKAMHFFVKGDLNIKAESTSELYTNASDQSLVSHMQHYAKDADMLFYSQGDNNKVIAKMSKGNIEFTDMPLEEFMQHLYAGSSLSKVVQGVIANGGKIGCPNQDISSYASIITSHADSPSANDGVTTDAATLNRTTNTGRF